MAMVPVALLHRLADHDRGLLERWTLTDEGTAWELRAWIFVTHAGGAVVTIAAVLIPLLGMPDLRDVARRAAIALASTHLMVQLLKRSVGRPRPSRPAVIACPDRFSFPSGHATAALAVALSYGLAWPVLFVPLTLFAVVVGWSRVVLGVHYPGDVLVGQLLAIAGAVLATTLC